MGGSVEVKQGEVGVAFIRVSFLSPLIQAQAAYPC